MELTIEQAREYLATLGITLPDFVLQILVAQANEIDACLIGAGYSNPTALLIKLYLVTLLSMSQADKYVSSESAPSGASRSYRYKSLGDAWRGTLNLLQALDKAGCATDLIPPSPEPVAHGGLWVARGGCCDV